MRKRVKAIGWNKKITYANHKNVGNVNCRFNCKYRKRGIRLKLKRRVTEPFSIRKCTEVAAQISIIKKDKTHK